MKEMISPIAASCERPLQLPPKDSHESTTHNHGPPEASDHAAFAVSLGPIAFTFARIGIHSFHGLCAVSYFTTGALFQQARGISLITYLQAYDTILAPQYFHVIAIAHFTVGAVHAYFTVEPCLRIVTGRFCRTHRSRPPCHCVPARHALGRAAQAVYARVFSRRGLLGIESPYFEIVQLVREIVECSLQAYQAYQMSQCLSRHWLTRLYVGILVTNCWITPVVHHVVDSTPLRRALDRLLDVVLDFAASIGVPFALIATYWHAFDPLIRDFPKTLYFDDLWATQLKHESPLVFFGSWFDAFSRLLFSTGLLMSLHSVNSLVRKRQPRVSALQTWGSPLHAKSSKSSVHVTHGSRALSVGHAWLIGVGALVLVAHLHSELRTPPLACLLELRPWFVANPTCAIVDMNCLTNPASSGTAHHFHRVFGSLNPAPLVQIRFRHCHTIEVQPSIQRFPNLESLTFHNTTVLSWPPQAALTTTFHPHLMTLQFVRTDFPNGSLPDGLLSRQFPTSVSDISFSITNLASLPDDLDERWPRALSLGLNFCRLTEYPRVLIRLQPMTLILCNNAITELPAAAFEVPGQVVLGLNGNPITNLPEDVDVALLNQPSLISLDFTNVSIMTMWLLDAVATGGVFVTAAQTPYCTSNATESPASRSLIDCTDRSSDDALAHLVDD